MFRRLLSKSKELSKRAVAWRLEDLNPPSEKLLFEFGRPEEQKKWIPYSDKEHGGLSSVSFKEGSSKSTGVLEGHLSTELSDFAETRLRRSGFAGVRTFDDVEFPDLENYDTLALRVKGDGRIYLSNLRTESWVGGPKGAENNTWQAFIFAPKDEWSVVKIPFERFLPTWEGRVVDTDAEISLRRVRGMGISLTAAGGPGGSVRGEGPFRLEVDWVKGLRTK